MNKYYHCKTQEEYNWLMHKLDEEGYKWRSGRKPKEYGRWSVYKTNTVIELSDERICVCDTFFYKEDEGVTEFIDVGELMRKEGKFNLPSHYDFPNLKQSTMDIINIIAEENAGGVFKIGWYLANALKYLFRFRRKNGVADLKKARDYLDRLIDYFESEEKDADQNK